MALYKRVLRRVKKSESESLYVLSTFYYNNYPVEADLIPRDQNRTALITGASSGIGYELAKIFAERGHDLVLVARSEKVLNELAGKLQSQHGVSVHVIPKDLSHGEAPDDIFHELQKNSIQIDFLVNNAGYSVFGPLANTEIQPLLQMLQLNMMSLTHLTKLFLDGMIERKFGRILNLASTAAFQPGPLMACYYASKAYVLSFSEAIANELKGTGVTVTTLCPGPTETGFQKRGNVGASKLAEGKILRLMDAASVARKGYDEMMKGKTLVIPGILNRIVAITAQIVPRKVATQIARSLQENRK